ncbi:Na(+)-translocating NADH-quinone reductase subunit C [Anaerobiospirillum thomasii]|uniref:Na(+)-translocating NADH-quinone reductase subunit C n=1 Tax=Anaerobiospirillum thomasii TaxID=179995 RepID=A0A2X0V9U3_9GAMM|nr:Na(+)-translocating NADH-quinone reductase subunit C [Anaerobiospirillum thomasii]SPT69575.1 Na(+)-translocating NADH-quinone reductase subunit C [Anaerobiospirillum thomasii]
MPKLNKDSVFGTFVVIITFCLVCSVLVSTAVVALDPFKKAAIINDRQISILRVSGFEVQSTVAKTYEKHIDANLLDVATGDFLADRKAEADSYNFASLAKQPEFSDSIPADVDFAGIRSRSKLMPVYFSRDDEGQVVRIILPFYGQALWSTAYGYIAVAADGNTIEAVTFYSHGETPGLGGEIDNPRWQSIWVGKKLMREDNTFGFKITKTPDHSGEGKDYDVDTLSGATLTARGVENAVRYWMSVAYRPFLDKLRQGQVDLSPKVLAAEESAPTAAKPAVQAKTVKVEAK